MSSNTDKRHNDHSPKEVFENPRPGLGDGLDVEDSSEATQRVVSSEATQRVFFSSDGTRSQQRVASENASQGVVSPLAAATLAGFTDLDRTCIAILHNNWLKSTSEKIRRQKGLGLYYWQENIDSCKWNWQRVFAE